MQGRERGSAVRRQWIWIGAVALMVAAVVVAVTIVVPGIIRTSALGGRHIVERKTAAQAFPGGLAHQPTGVNQVKLREDALRSSGQTHEANIVATIANQPIATWLTSTSTATTTKTVRQVVASAKQQGATPTFVLYDIPDRDCGHYSAGGLAANAYLPWVKNVVKALDGAHAVILVEPDSIAQIANCPALEKTRIPLLRKAVDALAGHDLTVYLDGGNENRVPVATMAKRLRQAGIDKVQGFFTNVSNFYSVDGERRYADDLADHVGGDPHYVIDVSRNGAGWKGTWCNPTGAALGQDPHVSAGSTRLDALLWVKTPGLSDGTCNGGPAAGAWFQSYALALVRNRH
jgi:cellulase/cellobiase CelA1